MEYEKGKRQLIIEAAIKIFGRDGFYKAKVGDIADEAGVGKGTIYEYFKSKKELFEEMIQYCVDTYYNLAVSSIEEETTLINKFKRYIAIEKEVLIHHGDLANTFMQEFHNIGLQVKNIMQDARNKKIHLIENIIMEGIETKIFKEVNPYMVALTFMGGIHQLLFDCIFMENRPVVQEDIDLFLDILLHGILN